MAQPMPRPPLRAIFAATIVTLGLTLVLAAPAQADRVVLTTGETLDGQILEQDDQRVLFAHPILGQIELKPADIRSIARDDLNEATETATSSGSSDTQVQAELLTYGPLAEPSPVPEPPTQTESPTQAEAQDGDQAEPKPEPEPESETKPTIQAEPDPEPKPKPQPKPEPQPQAKPEPKPEPRGGFFNTGLLRDWKTKLQFGVTNFDGDLRRIDGLAKLDTKRKTPEYLWHFLAEAFYSEDENRVRRNEGRVELTRRWTNPQSPWFLFATGRYQYNRLKVWEDRVGGYGGIGNNLIKADKFRLTAEAGLGGSYEFGTVEDFTPEAVFAAGAAAWSLTPRQELTFESRYFPNLEAFDEYRVEAELDWSLRLNAQTNTRLNLGVRREFENRINRDDRDQTKYFAALQFSF